MYDEAPTPKIDPDTVDDVLPDLDFVRVEADGQEHCVDEPPLHEEWTPDEPEPGAD
jgi:hypothetical protein